MIKIRNKNNLFDYGFKPQRSKVVYPFSKTLDHQTKILVLLRFLFDVKKIMLYPLKKYKMISIFVRKFFVFRFIIKLDNTPKKKPQLFIFNLMDFLKIQTLLGNFSFSILFILMLFFFIESNFKWVSKFHFLAFFGIIAANISLTLLLLFRWVEQNHFPLSNLYESLIFLSWSFTTIHIVLEKITNSKIIGLVISPISLFTNAFGNFSLPSEMQKASSLVPALQSNWLMMHVTIMMLSYAALITGSLFAFCFLIITHFENKKGRNDFVYINNVAGLETGTDFDTVLEKNSKNLIKPLTNQRFISSDYSKISTNLDNLSYRTLGLGFPLLTIGILSGAVWANEAWGSYWSWDPKETWAFITWLIYAIYLHTRITKGWQGTKPALIASIGFIVVWICYLGVNLLSKGLHSYGWVQSINNNL